MTVQELIDRLQALPDKSMEIRCYDELCDTFLPIEFIDKWSDKPRAAYNDPPGGKDFISVT